MVNSLTFQEYHLYEIWGDLEKVEINTLLQMTSNLACMSPYVKVAQNLNFKVSLYANFRGFYLKFKGPKFN